MFKKNSESNKEKGINPLLMDFDSTDFSVEKSKSELLDFCLKNNYPFYEKEQTENYIIEFKIKEDEKTYYFEALINKIEYYVEFNISQTRDLFVFDEDMLKRYLEDHHRESFYQKDGAIVTSHKQFTYATGLSQELVNYTIEWLIEKNNAACDDSECFLRLSEEFDDIFEEIISNINKDNNDEDEEKSISDEFRKALADTAEKLGESERFFIRSLCDNDDTEDA